MLFFENKPKRKPIKMAVKKEVYKRAKGKCERCGEKLEFWEGDFHHTRSPSISPTAKTVEFLCPNCHRKYGHTRKTVKHEDLWSTSTETKIKRHRVATNREKKPTKKKASVKKLQLIRKQQKESQL